MESEVRKKTALPLAAWTWIQFNGKTLGIQDDIGIKTKPNQSEAKLKRKP